MFLEQYYGRDKQTNKHLIIVVPRKTLSLNMAFVDVAAVAAKPYLDSQA